MISLASVQAEKFPQDFTIRCYLRHTSSRKLGGRPLILLKRKPRVSGGRNVTGPGWDSRIARSNPVFCLQEKKTRPSHREPGRAIMWKQAIQASLVTGLCCAVHATAVLARTDDPPGYTPTVSVTRTMSPTVSFTSTQARGSDFGFRQLHPGGNARNLGVTILPKTLGSGLAFQEGSERTLETQTLTPSRLGSLGTITSTSGLTETLKSTSGVTETLKSGWRPNFFGILKASEAITSTSTSGVTKPEPFGMVSVGKLSVEQIPVPAPTQSRPSRFKAE